MSHVLRALEESLLTADVRSNPACLRALLHEDFVEVGRSGRRWTRTQIIESLAEEVEGAALDTDEWQYIDLSPTLILVTYRIRGSDADSRHSSIWDTAGDSPRMRFHQGTPVAAR